MSDSEAISIILETINFAAQAHNGQSRKDDLPQAYINHPIKVAFLLSSVGEVRSLAVLQAAILHDTIEEAGDLEERKRMQRKIRDTFGSIVYEIVMEVTDTFGLSREEKKSIQIKKAPGMTWQAKLIKLADKTCNVTDILESPPAGWNTVRKLEYLNSAEQVVKGCRGENPELEKLFDKTAERARTELAKA